MIWFFIVLWGCASGSQDSDECKHGTRDKRGVCICDEGYIGGTCRVKDPMGTICDTPCNVGEACFDLGSGPTCYDEAFECFGIPTRYANACGPHGDCIAPDTCHCARGYISPDCSVQSEQYGVAGNMWYSSDTPLNEFGEKFEANVADIDKNGCITEPFARIWDAPTSSLPRLPGEPAYKFETSSQERTELSHDESLLRDAILRGNFTLIQKLHSDGMEFGKHMQLVFWTACVQGRLDMAKWALSQGGVDIHEDEDHAFRWACFYDQLEVAQWLYSKDVPHTVLNMVFPFACSYGRLKVVRWLSSLDKVDIHADDDLAFQLACMYGKLDVAQWLYAQGGIDIREHVAETLGFMDFTGQLKAVSWLLSLDDHHTRAIHEFIGKPKHRDP